MRKYGHSTELAFSDANSPLDQPFVFNGQSYRSYYAYRTLHWKPKFVSLQDLKDRYAEGLHSDLCIFMFDDIFLPYDVGSYLFDEAYIDSVRIYQPLLHKSHRVLDSMQNLDDCGPFVIRVFSKSYERDLAERNEQGACTEILRHFSQYEEDRSNTATFLNGTFVGSTIGLDIDSLMRLEKKGAYRVSVRQEAYEAGGVYYDSRMDIECEDYRSELVPLTGLVDPYSAFGSFGGETICIVNGILVLNPKNILIDKNYISVIRTFSDGEMDCLPSKLNSRERWSLGGCPFGVVQIYVKDAYYVKERGIIRIS